MLLKKPSLIDIECSSIDAKELLRSKYLSYALKSLSRAFPDISDGLRPVQRRILWAMGQIAFSSYKKSARIDGETTGKYHPHGTCYLSAVKMAQPFGNNAPLVSGQGNFGSIDGDDPAHARYTEMRLSPLGRFVMSSVSEKAVSFIKNYDESLLEPSVLNPLVNLGLINGAIGISVCYFCCIAQHNPMEIIDLTKELIKNPDLSNEDVCKIVPGPDFATKCIIYEDGLKDYSLTGSGSVTVECLHEIHREEKGSKKRPAIYIKSTHLAATTINKSSLIKSVVEAAKSDALQEVYDIVDETIKDDVRIAIYFNYGTDVDIGLTQLRKYTKFRTKIGYKNLFMFDGAPKVFNLKDACLETIRSKKASIRMQAFHDLEDKVERMNRAVYKSLITSRKHIVDIVKNMMDHKNIDETIDYLSSIEIKIPEEIYEHVSSRFQKIEKVPRKYVLGVLEMPISKLTGFEMSTTVQNVEKLAKEIAEIEEILSNENSLNEKYISKLEEMQKFVKPRVCEIVNMDNVSQERTRQRQVGYAAITDSNQFLYLPKDCILPQHRGGTGKKLFRGHKVKCFIEYDSHCTYMVIYKSGCGAIIDGESIRDFFNTPRSESVFTILAIKPEGTVLFIGTEKGKVKKMCIKGLTEKSRKSLIRLCKTEKENQIAVACIAGKGSNIGLFTRNGRKILCSGVQVRERSGRNTYGTKAIKLDHGDTLCSLHIETSSMDDNVFLVDSSCYGKLVKAGELFKKLPKSMGGKGRKTNVGSFGKRNRHYVGVVVCKQGDCLMMVTQDGQSIVVKADEFSMASRHHNLGVKVSGWRLANIVGVIKT